MLFTCTRKCTAIRRERLSIAQRYAGSDRERECNLLPYTRSLAVFTNLLAMMNSTSFNRELRASLFHLRSASELVVRVLVVAALVTGTAVGQVVSDDVAQRAEALAKRATRLMDRDMGEAAAAEWKKAIDLVPNHAPYLYEYALTHVMMRKYEEALAILRPIYSKPELFDRGYQLMGNIHDFMEDSSSALTYYHAGIEAFPKSGRLHYELGAAAFIRGDVVKALDWWKRGTQVEPIFPTNYFWLAKVYSTTPNRYFSVMYAEAFLNLERATNRTKEISKLVFDTWNASMSLGDTLDPINFFADDLLDIPSKGGPNVMNLPTAFEYSVATSAEPLIPDNGTLKGALTLDEMVDVRVRVAKYWKEKGYDKTHNNDVMAWNATLATRGWIREYLYWLYSYGDVKRMNDYFKANEQRYDTFLAWFGQNQMSFQSAVCLDLDCP